MLKKPKIGVFDNAGVAQLVEHHLAKVDVDSSNLFARSIFGPFVPRESRSSTSGISCLYMKASELFNLPDSLPFSDIFDPDLAPWEWVSLIEKALNRFKWPERFPENRGALFVEGPVFIHSSVRLPPYATIIGPAYIGAGTEIRPGAYIRGNVIVGENCVLGNACEFKNVLLMDDVHVPHFSYVGDSILGNKSHLGAGVVLSNLRFDQADVSVVVKSEKISTGRMKLGAMLGDEAEVGCNSVLQPGTILGKRSIVVPAIAYGGTLEAGQIARTRTSTISLPRRD